MEGPDAVLKKTVDGKSGYKCSTFGASSVSNPRLAVGNFDGRLQIWDLEQGRAPVWDAQAHASIVNAVDGMGGQVRLCYTAHDIVIGTYNCHEARSGSPGDCRVCLQRELTIRMQQHTSSRTYWATAGSDQTQRSEWQLSVTTSSAAIAS